MRAFELAKDIAALEVLFNRALASGVSGEPLTALAECRTDCLHELDNLGLAAHEQAELLHLFRSATQAGAELPLDGEGAGITPGMSALLREAGTHAPALNGYVKAVMSAFQGKATTDARRWLPGGDQFEEVQRQRERWGNDRFFYDDSQELPQEVAAEVLEYFRQQEDGLLDAESRMVAFVQGAFG